MVILLPKFGALFTSNGGSTGQLDLGTTVTDKVKVGCFGWVSDDNGLSQRVKVTEIVDSNSIRVVKVEGWEVQYQVNYTIGSNMSAWTTANTARFDMEEQLVPDNFA